MSLSLASPVVRAILMVVAVVLSTGSSPAAAAGQEPQRAILDLVVNQVAKGQTAAILDASEVWIPVSSLEDAEVQKFTGERQTFYGRSFVRLASLAPKIVFEYDERELELRVTVVPDLLGATKVSLQSAAPTGIVYSRATSGFLNYAVDWNGRAYNAFVDAGLSAGGALANTTLLRNPDGSVVRGYTSITVDDRQRLRRWVVGDSFANTGLLGGGVVLGGISVGREYGVDPYFMRYPSADLAGAVLSPSTLEVYVNDRLVGREQVAPGRFDLQSLPVSTGRADTRVVLRDAFGREQQLVSSFYLAAGGLASGQHDYRYSFGYRRREEQTSSWNYSVPALLARHRVGINDSLTAGMRLEMSENIASGGPMVNIRLPLGELEVATAASRRGSIFGGAASARYSYVSVGLNLTAAARYVSPHYATLGSVQTTSSPRWDAGLSAAIPVGQRGSLTLRHEVARRQDDSGGSTTSMLGSMRVSGRSYLTITGTNDWRDHWNGFQLALGVGVVLGPRTGATFGQTLGAGENRGTLELQRSLPSGTGYGYRLSGDVTNAYGNSSAMFQGPYGRYEITHDRFEGRQTTALHASGGIVAIGGGVYATRPVQDGFALVKVPGVAHVRAYASHQQVGRTNSRGNLLVPGLLPYYGNTLSIADQDIPLDRSVESTQRVVAPPFRGGATVTFPVRRTQHATGRVMLLRGSERIVPVYGQLTLAAEGQTYESPIGRAGEFYLENLPSGRYNATVLFDQRTCEFIVTTGVSTGETLQLGVLECSAPSTPAK